MDDAPGGGRLLRIFTAAAIGLIFFEVIQRNGDEGFGEGSFRTLFEAIEQNQSARGVLTQIAPTRPVRRAALGFVAYRGRANTAEPVIEPRVSDVSRTASFAAP